MMKARIVGTTAAVVIGGLMAPVGPMITAAMAAPAGSNATETVDTTVSASTLAADLVGAGVSVSNVQYTGAPDAKGTFAFADPTTVGMNGGIVLSSGNANEVVGPNTMDWNSTSWNLLGNDLLSGLSTYPTYDASVLSFDFVPTTNQVSFQYAFASDEYPEWVNTVFNDVFAFWVTDANGSTTNCATVRQTAGDPSSPQVPVAINNINDSNPVQDPPPAAMRPDLFRPNYVGSSTINLEMDGITKVLTCQAPVTPGALNHMSLAISDSSDGIYDSNVFIKASSLVSDAKPVADIGLDASSHAAPVSVSASVEGRDPNGAALNYSINWGDGVSTSPTSLANDTTVVNHTYQYAGNYAATLTVSNGTNSGTSCDEISLGGIADPSGIKANESCDVAGTGIAAGLVAATGTNPPVATGTPTGSDGDPPVTYEKAPSGFWGPGVDVHPTSVTSPDGSSFTMTAAANAKPYPTVQWQVSTDGGETYEDVPGATNAVNGAEHMTTSTFTATASSLLDGAEYQAVFTNPYGQDVTDPGIVTIGPAAVVLSVASSGSGPAAAKALAKTGSMAAPTVGQAAVLSVTVPSGKSGKVVVLQGGKKLTSFSVVAGSGSQTYKWKATGGKALTAVFTPTGSKKSFSSPLSVLVVAPSATSISITPPSKTVVNKSNSIKLKVSGSVGSKPVFTGGSFSVVIDDVVVASLAPNASGSATYKWTPSTIGAHTVDVTWSGTTTSLASNASRGINVVAK